MNVLFKKFETLARFQDRMFLEHKKIENHFWGSQVNVNNIWQVNTTNVVWAKVNGAVYNQIFLVRRNIRESVIKGF